MSAPDVGIFGLTGCAGDQLMIVNCEDELLDVVGAINLKSFLMAKRENIEDRFDVAFVEGSVVTREDKEMLLNIREKSSILVAIGTCACFGGIQASANDQDRETLLQDVYGTRENYYDAEKVKALDEVVTVDTMLPGCPIEKKEFLSSVVSLLNSTIPELPQYPVCFECKIQENRCILREDSSLCLGPVTRGGCKARCLTDRVGCIGCRGAVPEANTASELDLLQEKGYSKSEVEKRMKTFDHRLRYEEKYLSS